jgi:hypothetical protein
MSTCSVVPSLRRGRVAMMSSIFGVTPRSIRWLRTASARARATLRSSTGSPSPAKPCISSWRARFSVWARRASSALPSSVMSADCLAKKTVATGGGASGLGARGRGATLAAALFAAGEGATRIGDAGVGAAAGRAGVVAARIDSVAPCSSGVPNALSGAAGGAGVGSATGIGGGGAGGAVAVCAGSGAPLAGDVQPTGGSPALLGLAERADEAGVSSASLTTGAR